MTQEELEKLIDSALRRGVERRRTANPGVSASVLEGHRHRGEARALAYLVAATMGVRANALCSLRWLDVDLVGCTLTLRATHAKNRRETSPDLPTWLAEQLRSWKQRMAVIDGRVPQPSDRVFSLLPAAHKIKKRMDKDLAYAGIPLETEEGRVDFHALRTMAATQLYEAGVDSKTAASLLSVGEQVMHQRYAKLRKGRGREAVSKLPVPKVLPMSSVS